MNKFRFTLTALAIMAVTLMVSSSAQAQATRTWVSGVGDDANPCSRTAPCKTFAGAISKTATAGEISVLDPGGFGALTITKSITVNGEGTLAGVLAAGTTGFIINATDTSVININDVSVNGNSTVGTTFHGVRILQAGSVNLEDMGIYNFGGDGVTIAESSNVNVSLNRVTIRNITGAGIRADTSTGTARVNLRQTQITNSGTGVNARRNSRVTATDSTFALNSVGVHAEGNGGTAIIVLKTCQVSNNTSHGIQAGGGLAANNSIVRISNNAINNNGGAGVSIQLNGIVDSFLNNEILGNNPDGCGSGGACANASGSLQ